MRTSIPISLLSVLFVFMIWSCKQDEAVEIEHAITGQLTAGKDVSYNFV